PGDLETLLAATRGPHARVAIRALGRLQRRELIPQILPHLSAVATRGEAATALAMALRGSDAPGVAVGQPERSVVDGLIAAGDAELARTDPEALSAIAVALGHVPYKDADGFKASEAFLRRVMQKPFPLQRDEPHAYAARGLEAMTRLNRKLGTLDE